MVDVQVPAPNVAEVEILTTDPGALGVPQDTFAASVFVANLHSHYHYYLFIIIFILVIISFSINILASLLSSGLLDLDN